MKKLLMMALMSLMTIGADAQRVMDQLDRGLVAVKVQNGVFCSWRITGEEYDGVTYNLYRDGTLIAERLSVSNYTDAGGTAASQYAVAAVVRGQEQQACEPVQMWRSNTNYLEIPMDHGTLTSTYIPNDACCADVDGDGQLEILLKFDNASDADNRYMPGGWNGEYAIVEVYKLDGTKLWWLDFGPNMGDFQNNENNIVAYDWDQDGKAEALMRAADGTVIHAADGNTYTVGDATKNYRSAAGGGGTNWFMHEGAEYLVYMNGATGKPYVIMNYPLKRLESGETDLEKAWGDGYGHRSTKHFFGAPFLDGRKPSIFLARGIYTRHKMIALDVDPVTHQLTERWRWNCSDDSSPWYGNGFHNYAVVDVDWDGRDEIVFGSMVIDDNGKGLSTTALGHGDAQHHGDFDPYTWGQEIFTCLEEGPVYGNCLRDGTTGKIYYKYNASADDGRAIMGNFSNDYPGAMGTSSRDPGVVSAVTHQVIAGATKNNMAQNMRIYWDGDLQEETFDYENGKNTAGAIYKYGRGKIATLTGSMTNNDTKGTPCFQGDLLGDWREEVIMRTANNNIRIYTTNVPTTWRNYTLWHDMQYRQAMVWQMCGYNQPPHVSYFLGELEGITQAPPALTMTGRTEVADGGTIRHDGETVITCETGDMTVQVADGATPYLYIDNAPSWVQGTNSNSTTNPVIRYDYFTHTLTGGAFAGEMKLVKQGDGVLVLPKVTETYSGATEVWGGTLAFDGVMQNSRVWLNRHTKLLSAGGTFAKGIQADYHATICPGGEHAVGGITTDDLVLNFGARVVFDVNDGQADCVTGRVLVIGHQVWPNGGGPAYHTPVFQIEGDVAPGSYVIGRFEALQGALDDVVLEGPTDKKLTLAYEQGLLTLTVKAYEGGVLTWTGAKGSTWNVDATANFTDVAGQETVFVPGSKVTFDDSATQYTVNIAGGVAPEEIIFDHKNTYTLKGEALSGEPTLTKRGTGNLQIQNSNQMGATLISGGTVTVSALGNTIGTEYGALGSASKRITIQNGAALSVNQTITSHHPILVGDGGAVLTVAAGKTLTQSGNIMGNGQTLTKKGSGVLTLPASVGVKRLVIQQGTVNASQNSNTVSLPDTVEFVSGALYAPTTDGMPGFDTKAHFVVPAGKSGTFYGSSRGVSSGKLTGSGTFTVYGTGVRCYWDGDWSAFEGTLVPALQKRGSYDPTFDFRNSKGLPKATLRLNSGVTFNSTNSISIGSVTGTGALGGNVTYTIGSNNQDFVADFSSTAPVIKVGEGVMTVNTSGKLKSNVTIKAGGLHFNASETESLFGGSLTAEGTASVVGSGQTGAITMRTGTQLTPRSLFLEEVFGGVVPANIKSTAAINMNVGSTLNMLIADAESYSSLSPRFLTLNGTLKVVLADDYQPRVGDSFTLWQATSTVSGSPAYDLPTLPSGMAWDTSALMLQTGVLRIVDATSGISTMNGDEQVRCDVYTIGGRYVTTVTSARDQMMKTLRACGIPATTYVLRCKSAQRTWVEKKVIQTKN